MSSQVSVDESRTQTTPEMLAASVNLQSYFERRGRNKTYQDSYCEIAQTRIEELKERLRDTNISEAEKKKWRN